MNDDLRRRIPYLIAVGRIAFGSGLMVSPSAGSRLYLGVEAKRPSVRFMSRIFGVRDVALGVALLQALREDRPESVTSALLLGAGCDTWDAVAALRGRDLPIWGRLAALLGTSFAALGIAVALAPGTGLDAPTTPDLPRAQLPLRTDGVDAGGDADASTTTWCGNGWGPGARRGGFPPSRRDVQGHHPGPRRRGGIRGRGGVVGGALRRQGGHGGRHRGSRFHLRAPVAYALGTGLVPVRKVGKLPAATMAEAYVLEYGEATLELHIDAVGPGDRVLIVDDVIATGGTLLATAAVLRGPAPRRGGGGAAGAGRARGPGPARRSRPARPFFGVRRPPLSLAVIDAQEKRFAAAFAEGDIALAQSLYQPDVVYVSPTTRLFGWPARIVGLEQALEFIQVTITGLSTSPTSWTSGR